MNNADITLINLNMLVIRYVDALERELHVALGPLYLTSALEQAGFRVDHRDYQTSEADEPMLPKNVVTFCEEPAPVIGLSCMANLLPFTLLAAKELKEAYPNCILVLGGVGPRAVEKDILERFPWIDILGHGEGEKSVVKLVDTLKDADFSLDKAQLKDVPGIYYRKDGGIVKNEAPSRIENLESIGWPALDKIDYSCYAGHNIITSRGCPYECTFCSVAPIWGRKPYFRDPAGIVKEMRYLQENYGVELFLFQDEFFVSSKEQVLAFCKALKDAGLHVKWKAFARIDLTDTEVMKHMAEAGCVEIRFGIESGSNRILERTNKGFSIEEAMKVVSEAVLHFPRVDTFFIWGFPFETMDDFNQTLFQMISFRLIGARILPSLFCLLPQTEIYQEFKDKKELTFYPGLLPEYMLTGHEVCKDGHLQSSPRHEFIFAFIRRHPDLFPGFFHMDLEESILPKFEILQWHGFYASKSENTEVSEEDSCGAHSPRLDEEQNLGTLTRPHE